MERYATEVTDGVLRLETPDGWIDVGAMDDVVELVGGEQYTLVYDDEQASASWLQTDDDNTITFDVREHLREVDFREEFVTNVANTPMEPGEDGYPKRTALFADLMLEIWDSKGVME